MIKVGITGGIGSGKTTVCHLFETFGVPVFYADDAAKTLLHKNVKVISAVKKLFGKNIYDTDGNLKRSEVAALVFNNKRLLKDYNTIVHPAVFKAFDNWLKINKGHPYCIKEAALLFESGAYKELDTIITVTAPKAVRIQRIMKRDGASRKQVISRMENQWTEQERKAKADFRISNDGNHLLIPQVYVLHNYLKSMAEETSRT